MRGEFLAEALMRMAPSSRVLDVGGGRHPCIAVEARPVCASYDGLDVSPGELEQAPIGSYDATFVLDAGKHDERLVAQYDLILSWQVLEHVPDLEKTFRNLGSYLTPGGYLLAAFSGRNSVFACANRLLPYRVSRTLLGMLLHRPQESVFPAHYDKCTADGISIALEGWPEVDVRPWFVGASYLRFSRRLRAAYLRVEDWIESHDRRNLATHYVVVARR
jgi:SAM-dependent methyltransferase